jgi:hypothetical protein
MHAVGVIPQCFVAHSAGHRVTGLVFHEEADAILLWVFVLEPLERHCISFLNIFLGQAHNP